MKNFWNVFFILFLGVFVGGREMIQAGEPVISSVATNKLKVGPAGSFDRDIILAEPEELDFQSRKAIFNLREQRVMLYGDLLETPYHPSGEVFGQIRDDKPWWGIDGQFCKGPGEHSIDGMSEETRFFLNPFLLLGLDEGRTFISTRPDCVPTYPRPRSLKWFAKEAKAEAVYDISRFFRERARTPEIAGYDVQDLVNYNARDMGYAYIHADFDRSQNVGRVEGSRLFDQPIALQNYIHSGGSCGYPGGCNNASPYEPDLRFRIKGTPAVLTCQLWKTKPEDAAQKSDFTFVLYLN